MAELGSTDDNEHERLTPWRLLPRSLRSIINEITYILWGYVRP